MMTMSAIFGTLSRAACSRAPKSLFMLSCYWLLTVNRSCVYTLASIAMSLLKTTLGLLQRITNLDAIFFEAHYL